MIHQAKRLKDAGIFHDFTWPVTLDNCARYNLIYGWNGTGKSTLSRIFAHLESRTSPTGTISILYDGHEIVGNAFATTTVPIRVFNREFIERSVLATTQAGPTPPEVPAIFVIGEKNVENQRKADAARLELQKKESALLSQRSKVTDAASTLENFCTDQAKLIKDLLTKTGSAYNNYNKANFKTKAQQLASQPDPSKHVLTDTARAERLQQHQSTQRSKLGVLSYVFPNLAKVYEDLHSISERVVTSAVIESLKSDVDAASWIKDGLEKHKTRGISSCLFCDQKLPAARLDALNAHFNDAYQTFLSDIEKRIAHVDELEDTRQGLEVPKSAELYDHLADKFKSAALLLEIELKKLENAFAYVREQLVAKQKAPFEKRLVEAIIPVIDAEAITKIKTIIEAHNKYSDDFAKQVKSAQEALESSIVASAVDQFTKYQTASKDAEVVVTAAVKDMNVLRDEIAKLDKELREHRKPADELNSDLQHYLGHGDIQLNVSSTGYKITRHGLPATRLSEGEQTAIALLYFLKTLTSKDFTLSAGIVVLDDPICSLDANALFSAYGYIKERTKNAKQLFVLTHNFMFFRQVRGWFHKLRKVETNGVKTHPARFYMLRCSVQQGRRQSEICPLDKLLEKFESDYHYTFSLIHHLATGPAQSLDHYFSAPNLARKLMETFLAFHSPRPSSESIFAKLEEIPFDEHKKARIFRFLNEHSHSSAIGGDQQDFSSLNETPDVLKDLLAMIKVASKQHYDGMLALVT